MWGTRCDPNRYATLKTQADFSLTDLFDALDDERRTRDMSWAAVTREVNARFRDVPGHKPIATSTITGLSRKAIGEGDGILQMLLWLRRSPESFVPGFVGADSPRYQLRELGSTQILRWDTNALYSALNTQRRVEGMNWREVASEIDGFTPTVLTHLEKGGRTNLPSVMRLVAWLKQPAAVFTRASKW